MFASFESTGRIQIVGFSYPDACSIIYAAHHRGKPEPLAGSVAVQDGGLKVTGAMVRHR